MNKHRYRIVFNQTRGMLMVVAESARRQGKAGESGGPGNNAPAHCAAFSLSALSLGVLLFTGAISWAMPLQAQIVADRTAPGNRQASVLNTANGVLQVNIQTPSAAGVSRNVFSRFDVPTSGAVLNNTRTGTQTRLGGLVQGNPWLAAGTARVILNEVNTTSPSQLRGYVEVGGDRAEVVIANPAGIVCDGCGFINASRSTLTTGTPIIGNDGLTGFRVQTGSIVVQGAGLDASSSDYTHLIARAVEVNAGIWAQDLRINTGTAEVSADASQANPLAAGSPAPAFALDVAALGGMYANKITLVGSEAGLGMRNAGHLGASAGNVVVTVDGLLENSGRITASADVQASTNGGISNSGSVYALGNTSLTTRGDLLNSGLLAARNDLGLSATGTTSRIDSSSTSAMAAGLAEDGSLAAGTLQASATADIGAHGQNLAQTGIRLDANSLSLTDSQTATRQLELTARAGDIDASHARIGVDQTLSASASATLRSDAAEVSAARLSLTAHDLSNRGGSLTQTGSTDLAIRLPGALDNTAGKLISGSASLTLAASTLTNTDGAIDHAGSGHFSLDATTLNGARGSLNSAGTLQISAGSITLDGGQTRATRLLIDSARLSSIGGLIGQSGSGTLRIGTSQLLDNSAGTLASNGSVSLQAGELRNIDGTLRSTGDLAMQATSLDNTRGLVHSTSAGLELDVAGQLLNTAGEIRSATDLTLRADSLNSSGTLYSHRNLHIDVIGPLANSGLVAATGNSAVTARQLDSSSGSVIGAGIQPDGSAASTGTLSVSTTGALLARGYNQATDSLTFSGSSVDLSGSQTRAADIAIGAAQGDVLTRKAVVVTPGTLRIGAATNAGQTLDNHLGQLAAGQLEFVVANLDNRDARLLQTGAGNTHITTGTLDNSNGEIVANSRALSLSADTLLNVDGRIEHTGSDSLALAATTLTGTRGTLLGNAELRIDAPTLNLDSATTRANRIQIRSQTFSHQAATLIQGGTGLLDIQASTTLDNTAGSLLSNGGTRLQAGDLHNQRGTLQSTGSAGLALAASGTVDNSHDGLIGAAGPASIDAARFDNTDGQLAASRNLALRVTGAADNTRGLLTAGQALQLDAASMDNTDGLLRTLAGPLQLGIDGALLNLEGQIGSGDALDARVGSLLNTGTLYATGRLQIQAADLIDNRAILAAGSNAELQARSLSSSAEALLGAGIRSDGSLAGSGNLLVSTTDGLGAHGQNLAAGSLQLEGRDVDLAGSQTQASAMRINATRGDIRTAGASLVSTGELTLIARSSDSSRLDNRQGSLSASHLDIQVAQLDNRLGRIVENGSADTTLALTSAAGVLDNSGGLIASNSQQLTLSAHTLANTDGRIEHAGSNALRLSADTLDNLRGHILGNGALQLTAGTFSNASGILNGRQLNIHAGSLDNQAGQIVHAGTQQATLDVSGILDNRKGMLASAGDVQLTAGTLLNRAGSIESVGSAGLALRVADATDNSAAGRIIADGTVSLTSGNLDNRDGQIASRQSLTLGAAHAIDNGRGILAAEQGLTLQAASFDNTDGTLQALRAALGIELAGSLGNPRGLIFAGTDLSASAGSLGNSGTLHAVGNNRLSLRDGLDNSAVITAGGMLAVTASHLESSATGLLGAGITRDGTFGSSGDLSISTTGHLAALGRNLSAGSLSLQGSAIDLSASQTQGNRVFVHATNGDVLTSRASVVTPGVLAITAQGTGSSSLDNRGGELIAGHLDLQLANLDNRGGRIVQSGNAATVLALTGSGGLLDNRGGLLAGNGVDFRLSADTIANSTGRIEHAGSGDLALAARNLDNTNGAIAGNSSLRIDGDILDNASGDIGAQRLNLHASRLDNRNGRLIQSGTASTGILADNLFDNTGGLLASNGTTTLTVGDLFNRGGTLQTARLAALQLQAAGQVDNSTGSIVASGSLDVRAAGLSNTGGQLAAGQTLRADIGGNLDNRSGIIAANRQVNLGSGSLQNSDGQISAVLDGIRISTRAGLLDNGQGRIEAAESLDISGQGIVNAGGSISARAIRADSSGYAFDNCGGQLAAIDQLTLLSGALDNHAGTLQAGRELFVDTGGQALLNTGSGTSAGIFSQGRITLLSGLLDNSAGFIGASRDIRLQAGPLVNRDGGAISTETSLDATLNGFDNRGGQLQTIGDLRIDAGGGVIDNTASLIRSGGTATLTAARFINRSTLQSSQGTEGRSLFIQAGDVDNRDGALRADDTLDIAASRQVDNTSGLISAGHTLRIHDATPLRALTITNTDGTLIAGQMLEIDAASLTGDGKVLSLGDLSVHLTRDYIHTGIFAANGNASLVTSGNIVNRATLEAGQRLHLEAADIDNLASGEIRGDSTDINATATLTNRGLIDGRETRINANRLDNLGSGRIYGDHLAIQANTLNNDVEGTQSATLAARTRLDLAVQSLGNREHALIFSAGDMAIGGALDASGQAIGLAGQVRNDSATIEALGNLSLAAAQLTNSNAHFSTRLAAVGAPEQVTYIQPNGTIGKYPLSMFTWRRWSKAGYYNWNGDAAIAGFGRLGQSPIPRVAEVGCADEDPGEECHETYALDTDTSYPSGDPAWAYFRLTPPGPAPVAPTLGRPVEPSLHTPVAPDPARASACQASNYNTDACTAYTADLDQFNAQTAANAAAQAAYAADTLAFDAAWSAYERAEANWQTNTDAAYSALDSAIEAYNATFERRQIKEWTQYRVTQTVQKSIVASSDPGQILAGGSMHIEGGTLINDKSRILAGGTLAGDLQNLINVEGQGQQIKHEEGTSQYTWTKFHGNVKGYHSRRWGNTTAYRPADEITTLSLPVTETRGNTAPAGSGTRVDELGTTRIGDTTAGTGNAQASARSGTIIEVRAAIGGTASATTARVGEATVHDAVRSVAAPRTGSAVSAAEGVTTDGIARIALPATRSTTAAPRQSEAPAPSLIPADAVTLAAASGPSTGSALPGHTSSPLTGGPAIGTAPASVIRSVVPDTRLPTSSLFAINPAAEARYLVETDPRFTNRQQWLSSDYMLGVLSVDPASVQKRLGDGFYEQRLIREQVAQLTGRRFLDGYADDETQYLALLTQGATYARDWQLIPGVALSAEQMAGLTSDIVWLVDQIVTLADGSSTHALVPRLYARVAEGDLDGSGALISGDNLQIALTGDLDNSGLLAGRKVVSLSAENVKNLGGSIYGTDVSVSARQDLINAGGTLRATDSLTALAGRDLTVNTTTRSSTSAQGNYTGIDRIAGLYVTGSTAAGQLVAAAGRDLTLAGATLRNDATASGSTTLVSAGRDIKLDTVSESRRQETVWDASNYRKDATRRETGTTLGAAGDIRLEAGQDISLRAASLTSDKGALDLLAGRDITLTAGRDTLSMAEAHRHTDSSTFGSETSISRQTLARDSSLSTTLSANTVRLQSGQDIAITGSNVASTAGTSLLAGRDVRIEADTDRLQESRYNETRQSGLISSGGIGYTIGSRMQSLDNGDVRTTAAGSTVGSTEGNVLIEAGKNYRQIGSHILAPQGDIGITASKVDILEARETGSSQTEMSFRQSGMTVAVTSPVISAIQTAEQMSRAVSRTDDSRMHALAAASTALSGLNAYNAVEAGQGTKINGKEGQIATGKDAGGNTTSRDANAADKVGGINISISIGTSASQSKTLQKSDTAAASTIMAGGNMQIAAGGAGQDSTLTVQGSDIRAGNTLSLAADNAIHLLAAQNTAEQHSTNKSSSGSVGVGFALGGTQNGFTLQASASAARGNADGNDVTWRNSHVEAGNTLALKSGGDTTLSGAVARGQQVNAEIGGNLTLESLQDTSQYKSKQQSVGASVSLCIPPFCFGAGSTGSVSVSQSKAMSNYASVTEQSGLQAGDGGFQVDVKGNADLKGAVIASSEQAVQAGKNSVSAATLTSSDIKNHAEASASSSGINLSSDMFSQGKYGGAKSIIGNALNNANESEASSGRTLSAVSGGAVSITDDEQQRKLTGLGAEEALGRLNRDVANTHTSAQRQDVTAMKEVVEADRTIKQETMKIVSIFNDAAYRSRFKETPSFLKVECPEGGNCVTEPDKLKRTLVTQQEVAANISLDMVLAVNGILNDEKRAAELAYQNAETLINPETGRKDLKPGTIYLMHIKPAENDISELIGVAYEKISNSLSYDLANFLGYTNGVETYSNALASRGNLPTASLGHSRGTLVQESAFTILANRSGESNSTYTNPNLTVRGVGGAANTYSYYAAAATVQGPQGNRGKITSSYFSNDPVSTFTLSGGNPGAWTLQDLWQVFKTDNSMHSCYGTGGKGCTQVETPVPGGPQGTPDGNAKLIQFKAGKMVNSNGEPVTAWE